METDRRRLSWDQRFAGADYHFGEAPNAFLAGCAPHLAGRRNALAIADGEGRNGVWLAEQGLDVLAFDASPVGLDKAQALAARRGVKLRTLLCDAGAFDWRAERFDVVVAIFIQFAPPPLRERIFSGILAALAPGGVLILEGYRPEQLAYGTGGPPQVEQLYDRVLLLSSFSDLEILHLEERDVVLAEGSGHDGMSAVIDFVARRPL